MGSKSSGLCITGVGVGCAFATGYSLFVKLQNLNFKWVSLNDNLFRFHGKSGSDELSKIIALVHEHEPLGEIEHEVFKYAGLKMPEIEIWNLDVIDVLEPTVILGGRESILFYLLYFKCSSIKKAREKETRKNSF